MQKGLQVNFLREKLSCISVEEFLRTWEKCTEKHKVSPSLALLKCSYKFTSTQHNMTLFTIHFTYRFKRTEKTPAEERAILKTRWNPVCGTPPRVWSLSRVYHWSAWHGQVPDRCCASTFERLSRSRQTFEPPWHCPDRTCQKSLSRGGIQEKADQAGSL